MQTTEQRARTETSVLEDAFPFFFALDNALRITGFGPSFAKVVPTARIGAHLSETLRIERPVVELNHESIRSKSGIAFLLDAFASNVTLRGQFLSLEDGLFFAGSLWNCFGHAFDTFPLSLGDFAPQDASIENWFITQTRDVQLRQLGELVRELQDVATEKQQLTNAEQELLRDLNAAADVQIRFTESGEIIDARSANPSLLPTPQEGLTGANIHELLKSVSHLISAGMTELDRTNGVSAFEYELDCEQGGYYFDARIAKPRAGEYLLLSRDVTTRRIMEFQLLYETLHDSLTDLPNRRQLEERMETAFEEQKQIALFLVDLDDFKLVNDSFGHAVGDRMLRETGLRLKNALTEGVMPARLGGDEFAILVEDFESLEELTERAQHVVELLSEPFHHASRRIKSSCSLGIALSDAHSDGETLLRNADIAMYQAKACADEPIAIYNDAMHDLILQKIEIQSELEVAIEARTLVNYYQPIVDLQTGEIAAFEALVRWPHESRGLLTPHHFIDIAERSGLIVGLGDLVLDNACREIVTLNKTLNRQIKVHVNLSSVQVEQADVVEKTLEVLRLYSLAPELVSLEITESLLIKDFAHAISVVTAYRKAGLSVSLDDFGVGYSSLNYLEQFPIETLKLDRSFVQKLDRGDERSDKLVRGIVSLAKDIDLNIVGEGVETKKHHDRLREFGCEFGQGYLYAKPMPFEELSQFVQDFDFERTVS